MGFLHKLHIIYLINDVLHNAVRKTTLNVKSQIQEVIVPVYCHTFVGESHENQQRCEKVVRIWETNSYFDSDVIEVRFFKFQCSLGCSTREEHFQFLSTKHKGSNNLVPRLLRGQING